MVARSFTQLLLTILKPHHQQGQSNHISEGESTTASVFSHAAVITTQLSHWSFALCIYVTVTKRTSMTRQWPLFETNQWLTGSVREPYPATEEHVKYSLIIILLADFIVTHRVNVNQSNKAIQTQT